MRVNLLIFIKERGKMEKKKRGGDPQNVMCPFDFCRLTIFV